MTLLVKNEEGMLEENLQFHKAMGVDGFIITDNNSTDSTPDIIRKYKQKGWIKEVIEEKATNYEQKDWVDRMIWKAKTIYKADWIINADADELWYAPTGNLKDELYATNANVLNCEMRSVYPEEEKPFWQWDKTVKAVTEPEKYDLSLYSLFERQNKKVIHRTAGYLQISMGNHKVTMFPQNSAPRAGKFFLWCHLACRKLRPLTGMQITSPPDNGGCRQRILGVRAVPRALCEPLCRPAFRPVLSCPGSLCVRRRFYFRITGLQHVLYHAGKQFARWNCAKEADQ